MPKGYLLQSDTAGADGHPALLATTTGVDLKTVGVTNLFTVPTGKSLILLDVILGVTAADTVTVVPIVSIGKSAAYNEWVALTTVTGLNGIGKTFSLATSALGLIKNVFTTGEIIALNVGTGATAVALTSTVYLIGILI